MSAILTLLASLSSMSYFFSTFIAAILFVIVLYHAPDKLDYVLGFLGISYIPIVTRVLSKQQKVVYRDEEEEDRISYKD
ncbi:MAG: hypothetical protein QXI58_06815 [Candidatus Micrarchaeia archaeon]